MFDAIAQTIVSQVEDLLQLDKGSIHKTTRLLDSDGFNSRVIFELLDRMETILGQELDPAALVPETFATPETLATAFLAGQRHEAEAVQ